MVRPPFPIPPKHGIMLRPSPSRDASRRARSQPCHTPTTPRPCPLPIKPFTTAYALAGRARHSRPFRNLGPWRRCQLLSPGSQNRGQGCNPGRSGKAYAPQPPRAWPSPSHRRHQPVRAGATDLVLIYLAGHWRGCASIPERPTSAWNPGSSGLRPISSWRRYGRKIGPDPASISACMIGGIVANNSSGMCCGTAENSYKTVASMRLVFADGETLDTADPVSKARFAAARPDLLAELAAMRAEILANNELAERIRHKFKIKTPPAMGSMPLSTLKTPSTSCSTSSLVPKVPWPLSARSPIAPWSSIRSRPRR